MTVEERLRARIAATGPISFAEFMHESLYGEGGYYRRPLLAIGEEGDFVTGSSCSPLFGRTTARLLRRLDEVLESPADFVEVGPGNGDHLRAVLDALGGAGGRRVFACDRIERPLAEGVTFVADVEELPQIRGLVFSYELFDALPVHRLLCDDDGSLRELGVAIDPDGRLAWQPIPLTDGRLEVWLERATVSLVPGQVADISLEWEPTYRRLSRALEAGLLVTCDYGFETAALFDPRVRLNGTVAAYREHRVHRDVLRAAGEQDLTAHVDFGRLRQTGEAAGLHTIALLRQGSYLAAAGLFEDLQDDPGRRFEAQQLLAGEGMGESIRVLLQARGTKGQDDVIHLFEGLFNTSNKFSKQSPGQSSI